MTLQYRIAGGDGGKLVKKVCENCHRGWKGKSASKCPYCGFTKNGKRKNEQLPEDNGQRQEPITGNDRPDKDVWFGHRLDFLDWKVRQAIREVVDKLDERIKKLEEKTK